MGGNIHSKPIPRQTGRVKWFSKASGFGFIEFCLDTGAVKDKGNEKNEIFVHYSSICANGVRYRYLAKDEEVEFDLTKPVKESDFEFIAGNVTGLGGGELMCKTANRPRSLGQRSLEQRSLEQRSIEQRSLGHKPSFADNPEFIPIAHRHKANLRHAARKYVAPINGHIDEILDEMLDAGSDEDAKLEFNADENLFSKYFSKYFPQ